LFASHTKRQGRKHAREERNVLTTWEKRIPKGSSPRKKR